MRASLIIIDTAVSSADYSYLYPQRPSRSIASITVRRAASTVRATESETCSPQLFCPGRGSV